MDAGAGCAMDIADPHSRTDMAIDDILRKAAERARQMGLSYGGALTPSEAHELWRNAPGAKLVDLGNPDKGSYTVPGGPASSSKTPASTKRAAVPSTTP